MTGTNMARWRDGDNSFSHAVISNSVFNGQRFQLHPIPIPTSPDAILEVVNIRLSSTIIPLPSNL
jgi:hypothetical protein